MHLTLNLSLTYRDLSLLDAVAAASDARFSAIEFWWPSAAALAGASLDELAAEIQDRGLAVDLINVPAGDMAAGDRGIACDPGRTTEFRAGVEAALTFAARVGVPRVNALAGKVAAGQSRDDAVAVAVENIGWAADQATAHGISVVIEPLNPTENAGYLWPTVAEVAEAITTLGRDDVGVLLDVYHVAMGGQDPAEVIRSCGAPIGHVQLADNPGRHEPGTGELDFVGIVQALRPVYDGGLGIECLPLEPGRPDVDLIRKTLASV